MHSILKILQALAPVKVNSRIKLFAKFHPSRLQHQGNDQKQNKWQQCFPIIGSLVTSVLAGTFAGFFTVDQLISVISVGTILMFYALSLNMLILRQVFASNVPAKHIFLTAFDADLYPQAEQIWMKE